MWLHKGHHEASGKEEEVNTKARNLEAENAALRAYVAELEWKLGQLINPKSPVVPRMEGQRLIGREDRY